MLLIFRKVVSHLCNLSPQQERSKNAKESPGIAKQTHSTQLYVHYHLQSLPRLCPKTRSLQPPACVVQSSSTRCPIQSRLPPVLSHTLSLVRIPRLSRPSSTSLTITAEAELDSLLCFLFFSLVRRRYILVFNLFIYLKKTNVFIFVFGFILIFCINRNTLWQCVQL